MESISPPPTSIGVIICTTRNPRACPKVANFVIRTIESSLPANTKLAVIDLETWNLPMFNEPTIPQTIKSASDYVQPHTRAWSLEIQKHSAFIFVTPQYNWGYPAAIKNALDYLFNEWAGKPAMIVSYGGHGGTKAGKQLKEVCEGLHMRPIEKVTAMSFGSRETMGKASKGLDFGLEDGSIWEGEKEGIREAFGELIGLLK